jgi:hypothetical protein
VHEYFRFETNHANPCLYSFIICGVNRPRARFEGRGGVTVIVFLMALFLLIGGLPSNLPTPGKIVGLFNERSQAPHTLQITANKL